MLAPGRNRRSRVAGLLLSRAASRERDVAIRASIGAGRARILRQFLAESLLLGLGAGVVGLALAIWLHDPLLKLFVPGATTIDLDTGVDWRVLGFVAGVSVLTGIAAGLAPAIRGSRIALAESLKQHSRAVGTAGRRALLTGRALVAAQMAFSLLLLIVAGLFGRSLQSLARTNVGFERDHLLVAGLDVRGAGYTPSERFALYDRLLERLRRVPGIESVGLSENGPMNNSSWRSSLAIEGYTPRPGESLQTNEEIVAGDYFQAVGLHVLEGRYFDASDRRAGTRSTIVNATMAKRFFAGQSAIGKRWSYGGAIDADAFTIVGVVEDARYRDVRETPPNMAYHPAEFDAGEAIEDIEMRTATAPAGLVASVREALRDAEPRLPVTEIVPFEELLPFLAVSGAGRVRHPGARARVPGALRHDVLRHQPPRGGAGAAHGARRGPRQCAAHDHERGDGARGTRSSRGPAPRVCRGTQPGRHAIRRSGGRPRVVLGRFAGAARRRGRRRLYPGVSRVAHQSDGGAQSLTLRSLQLSRRIADSCGGMIWFFERQDSRLRYEIRRQADGHEYELVVTRPDGGQDIERYPDALPLLQRTEALERSLREDGWQAPHARARGARCSVRGARRDVRGERAEV